MTIKSENKIVDKIKKWVKAQGGKALKIHGGATTQAGEPDIFGALVYKNRHVIFVVEIKQPGEEPEKLQYQRLVEWQRLGLLSFWATSLEEFKAVLDKFVEYQERIEHERARKNNQRINRRR